MSLLVFFYFIFVLVSWGFCLLLLVYPDLVDKVACSSEMPVGKDKTKSPKTLKLKEWENGELFYNGTLLAKPTVTFHSLGD